jgi:hypothetical protein
VKRIGPGRIEALQHIAWLWRYHAMMLNGPQHDNGSPKRHQHILTVLSTFWRYQCTERRERLFALYNMASDIQASQPSAPAMQGPVSSPKICMEIDYALDVRQILPEIRNGVCLVEKDSGNFEFSTVASVLGHFR